MKRILFRADAHISIGSGDLVSLIHLSDYFSRSGWEIHFMLRNYDIGMSIARQYRLKKITTIASDVSVENEVSIINEYIFENNINVVFLEITERPLTEYRGLTKNVIKGCVCFDGLIPNDMDLVVNWDIGSKQLFNPSARRRTRFLLGPKYAILPISFNNKAIANRIYKKKTESVLVTMGGVDKLNLTRKVTEILIEYNLPYKIKIVLGVGYKYRSALEKMLSASGLKYKIEHNVTNMLPEYLECDVAVASGGLTAYELIAAKTPAVLIAAYKHQIKRCLYFVHKKLVKYIGFRDFDREDLIKNIQAPLIPVKSNIFHTEKIKEAIDEIMRRR